MSEEATNTRSKPPSYALAGSIAEFGDNAPKATSYSSGHLQATYFEDRLISWNIPNYKDSLS
ncbi:MAG TPA: hypothetical protein QF478_12010, partial [Verrucomicrobiota bacterium]|nr:hypothetical protein [Verrucomicrobiota bacterium]